MRKYIFSLLLLAASSVPTFAQVADDFRTIVSIGHVIYASDACYKQLSVMASSEKVEFGIQARYTNNDVESVSSLTNYISSSKTQYVDVTRTKSACVSLLVGHPIDKYVSIGAIAMLPHTNELSTVTREVIDEGTTAEEVSTSKESVSERVPFGIGAYVKFSIPIGQRFGAFGMVDICSNDASSAFIGVSFKY